MSKIELIPNASGYEMRFLSGVRISLPTKHGFYIADSACGDGKTTMIIEIAKLMAPSGVLIVTQTTEAADGIYQSLCDSGLKGQTCILHSQKAAESYLTEHRETPEKTWNYNILIITAVRLQHYPIDLFVKFGMPDSKYREYILIDEIISFFPEHPLDTHKLLPDVSYISASKTSKEGKRVKEIKMKGKTMYQYIYNDSSIMEAAVKANPKHKEHFKNELAISRLRDILKSISTSGILEPPTIDTDILGANSTVILFDGTADVLLPKDKRLLYSGSTSASKYSSNIKFEQFHLPFRRRNDSDWDIETLRILGKGLFQKIANLTQTEKVLVITWKDIDRRIKCTDTDKLEEKEYINFPDELSKILDEYGAVKANYGIIYRGSGLERGCNIYRNFQTVYFLGEWYITDDITKKLNDFFKGYSTLKDYRKSLLIQSICRLRIRLHKCLPIKVMFSDDIDYNMMFEVQEYFKTNSKPGCTVDGVLEPLPKLDKREKNHLFDVAILAGAYPRLIDALSSKSPLSINIPKSELFRILPKDRKSIDRYRSLLDFLSSHRINLNII
ncbi:MAG: hypothetical protein HDR72_00005 [Ruminococcaceae bacterium]|nr:hypothetical protein [Oscillospiraceae bacterium]